MQPPSHGSPAPQAGHGGLAIVTGATGGLGWEVALGLARAGYATLLTGRNPARGADALARLHAAVPGATAQFALLDLASLRSVHDFASGIAHPVSVLVNNAGVMAPPRRQTTQDGFELQFGTNYLGHFALTARLLPHLSGGRVVNVSSVAHRRGRLHLDDLNMERGYRPWPAYQQSKLAMLMFSLELQRRSARFGWGVAAFAAHPGWSATNIVHNGPGGAAGGLKSHILQAGFNALGQSAARGAEPLLFAATAAGAIPGAYYGPCCWGETRGRTTRSRIMPQANDTTGAARLWSASEALTGTAFPHEGAPA